MTRFLTIAYDLSAINNHAYFFEEAPENIFCKSCGCCIDPSYQPAELRTPNKTDIGVTYDRRFIASLRFKEYIDSLDLNVDFSLINEKNNYFSSDPSTLSATALNSRKTSAVPVISILTVWPLSRHSIRKLENLLSTECFSQVLASAAERKKVLPLFSASKRHLRLKAQ